ncbi:MAG: hypothetical protein JXK05_06095 [Campylobacterales bacterium]|nr:hypothetical protein [Campylobacterales bacterium]
MKQDKTPYIFSIVVLTLLLGVAMAFVAYLESQQAGASWGTVTGIALLAVILGLFAVLMVLAVKLQRIIEHVEVGSTVFEQMGSDLQLRERTLIDYLEQPSPRAFNAAVFTPLYGGLMPLAAKMTSLFMIPMVMLLLIMGGAMLHHVTKEQVRLDKGPVALVQSRVIEAREHHSRSGNYVAFHYEYTVDGVTLQGRSCADEMFYVKDEQVIVEFLPATPSLSRIEGTRVMPIDMSQSLWLLLGILVLLLPGLWLFFYFHKLWLKRLLHEGDVVRANIISLHKGGKGMIFARVSFVYEGCEYQKRLSHPAMMSTLYDTLYSRWKQKEAIVVLMHPQSRFAYLIEPHLV